MCDEGKMETLRSRRIPDFAVNAIAQFPDNLPTAKFIATQHTIWINANIPSAQLGGATGIEARGTLMQGYHVLSLGSALSALAALPLASQAIGQGSPDAALEAACRATEVTAPDSCPCTVAKAREVGLSDKEMASLFKDDGHSQPVDQAKYTRFWQVKSQCLVDTTMAAMGVSAANPLPGIPANMRPKSPGTPAPPPSAQPATSTNPAALPVAKPVARSQASLTVEPGVRISRSVSKNSWDERTTVYEKYAFPNFDFEFNYDTVVRDTPALFERAKGFAQKQLPQWRESYSDNSAIRQSVNTSVGTAGSLDRLLTIGVTGWTNNKPQGQFLDAFVWDAELDREITWSDVFDAGIWNGKIRRDYCAGLQAERRERGTAEYSSGCPQFDDLLIEFAFSDAGELQLSFTALAYVAGSYAEGPYIVKLPIDDAVKAGVKEPYRALMGASGSAGTIALRDRLSDIVLGKPNYPQPPDCATEIFLAPNRIGSPQGIEDIRKLVERSPGRVFVQSAGMLDGDWYGAGVILDGRFLKLEETKTASADSGYDYRADDLIVDYVSAKEFAEVSYGGWGYGTLVITYKGQTERIPALLQAWQCT